MKLYADYAHASIAMVEDQAFIQALEDLIAKYQITHFFETGTNQGLGSTTMLANAILKSGTPVKAFYTVERDPFFHGKASKNLEKFPFVTPVLGLSVSEKEALEFLQNDPYMKNHEAYPDIFIDDVKDPVGFYVREIQGNLSGANAGAKKEPQGFVEKLKAIFSSGAEEKDADNLLESLVSKMADHKPLCLLDSAGGIGYLEFKNTMKVMNGRPFFLILDDTHHIKHWRSREDVLANPDFTVFYDSTQHGRTIAGYKIS
jgi:hypothetical protein